MNLEDTARDCGQPSLRTIAQESGVRVHVLAFIALSAFAIFTFTSAELWHLRKAMGESHMGHLSRFRLSFSRSRIAPSNDREMDVIVDINVFYSDLQARWITSGKFKIVHHCVTSSLSKM
jgi:hypothetical protein